MGRGLVIWMLVAGCGRFGFAPTSGADDTPELDAPIDSSVPSVPSICNARTIMTGQAGEIPLVVRATALASGGYAVAVGTDAGNVYVVRILPGGSLGGVHKPLTMVYALRSIASIDDNVFVYAINGGSTGYIKALDATWDAYATAQSAEPAPNDPALAAVPGTSRGWIGMRNSGTTTLAEVDATGSSTGLVADYQPAGVYASLAPTTTGVRAAVDLGTGMCETLLIAPSGVTSALETITPCSLPNLHPFSGDSSVMLYQTAAGEFAARILHADASAVEPTVMLGSVENPRVMTRDGRAWIASQPSGNAPVELRALDPDGSIEPGIAPGMMPPFDLLPGAAFWIDGDDLRGGEPCVN